MIYCTGSKSGGQGPSMGLKDKSKGSQDDWQNKIQEKKNVFLLYIACHCLFEPINHCVKFETHKQPVQKGHPPKKPVNHENEWVQTKATQGSTAWFGIGCLGFRGTVTINSRAESRQKSPPSGVTITYSHSQVEGGDFVFLWSYWHRRFKDGTERQQEGDSVIGVKCDVFFGKISCPAWGERVLLSLEERHICVSKMIYKR